MTSSCEEVKPSHKYQISSSTLRLRAPRGLITHRRPKSGNRSARYPSTRSDDDHRALKVNQRGKKPQKPLFFPFLSGQKSESWERALTAIVDRPQNSAPVTRWAMRWTTKEGRNRWGESETRREKRERERDRQTDRQRQRRTDRLTGRGRDQQGERERESSKGGGWGWQECWGSTERLKVNKTGTSEERRTTKNKKNWRWTRMFSKQEVGDWGN